MNLDGWKQVGWQVFYLDADDRDRKVSLPHGGRGVLTYYGEETKESWAPPADDIRMVWNEEYSVWYLYIPDTDGESRD